LLANIERLRYRYRCVLISGEVAKPLRRRITRIEDDVTTFDEFVRTFFGTANPPDFRDRLDLLKG